MEEDPQLDRELMKLLEEYERFEEISQGSDFDHESSVRRGMAAIEGDSILPEEFKKSIRELELKEMVNQFKWIDECFKAKSRNTVIRRFNECLLVKLRTSTNTGMYSVLGRAIFNSRYFFHEQPGQATTEAVGISPEENDILQYVCGVALRHMKKLAFRNKTNVARRNSLLDMVKALSGDRPASRMTECLDRGGLIHPHECMTVVMKRLECIWRRIGRSKPIREVCVKENLDLAVVDEGINKTMDALLAEQPEDRVEEFKYEFFKTFFIIRVNGLCRQAMEHYQVEKKTSKNKKSHRAELA